MSNASSTEPAKQASLTRRVAKASSWSLVQVMGINLLRLCSNLIMTRLLVPEAFGLMALVSVLIAGFSLFTDIGINRSVSREPDGDQDHFLRVAWVVKMARGAMISAGVLTAALLVWIFAPHYAPPGTVYANPDLPLLVALSALVPMMAGIDSTTRELSQRRLQMQYPAVLEICTQVITILAMVTFASFSATVWALMAGMLLGAMLRALSTHLFFPGPRMAFVWDREIADRLWSYGKWLMGSSIFTFFAVNMEKLLLGAFLDAATFGIFVIALIWIESGVMVIVRLSDGVGFPVISEVMRTRPADAPRLYRKLQTAIDGICFLAFVTLFFGGQLLIDMLYSQTYAVAGAYLTILSLRFLAARFDTVNGLIMNQGNSFAMMIISGVRGTWVCIALPVVFLNLGFAAALVVIALVPMVTVPYSLWLVRPYLGTKQVSFDLLWFIFTLIAAAVVYIHAAPALAS
ncbi:MAG: oligosaccharide flippase family protein [Pseudomonadota bacterium]